MKLQAFLALGIMAISTMAQAQNIVVTRPLKIKDKVMNVGGVIGTVLEQRLDDYIVQFNNPFLKTEPQEYNLEELGRLDKETCIINDMIELCAGNEVVYGGDEYLTQLSHPDPYGTYRENTLARIVAIFPNGEIKIQKKGDSIGYNDVKMVELGINKGCTLNKEICVGQIYRIEGIVKPVKVLSIFPGFKDALLRLKDETTTMRLPLSVLTSKNRL